MIVYDYYTVYVQIFLLWLLYCFMKPQVSLKDGKVEASTLLFSNESKDNLDRVLDENKEWIKEVRTEFKVALEFTDQRTRSSFYNYAQPEETEEDLSNWMLDTDTSVDNHGRTIQR